MTVRVLDAGDVELLERRIIEIEELPSMLEGEESAALAVARIVALELAAGIMVEREKGDHVSIRARVDGEAKPDLFDALPVGGTVDRPQGKDELTTDRLLDLAPIDEAFAGEGHEVDSSSFGVGGKRPNRRGGPRAIAEEGFFLLRKVSTDRRPDAESLSGRSSSSVERRSRVEPASSVPYSAGVG